MHEAEGTARAEDSPRCQVSPPGPDHWLSLVKCQAACPVRTDAGKYVQLIRDGDYQGAYLTARAPNPFASACGRICAAPCEDACRRGSIDAPVSIRALKRFVTERFGPESRQPETAAMLQQGATASGNRLGQAPTTAAGGDRRKVAVIGAGPAGLACAHDLASRGYAATVFEASDVAGGMMRLGIPEFRLPHGVLAKEVRAILDRGVEFVPSRPLTAEFGLSELKAQGFAAVFIGVGVQKGRDLMVEGESLDGVVKAVDYLLNANRGYRMDLGQRVVVIGGGFVAFDAARVALRTDAAEAGAVPASAAGESGHAVAMDAARLALRAGAPEVVMVSLEALDEMPVMRTAQGREEHEEALREGVRMVHRRGVKRIVGGDGRVARIELMEVTRVFDENGRFAPTYNPDRVDVIEASSVILAIGQKADLSFLRPADGVELTAGGTLKVDRATLATSAPGIYAGGDAAFGPRILIDAVANGRLAARSIDRYLRGAGTTPEIRLTVEKIPTAEWSTPRGFEIADRTAPPTEALDRRTGVSEVEDVYDEAEARRQAARCLSCHVDTVYDPALCVLCNRCVDVCPEACLAIVPLEACEAQGIDPEALRTHYGHPAATPLAAMLKDDTRCIRCGLCAIRCPTDAMTMEVFSHEER